VKEIVFLNKNAERWKSFEKILTTSKTTDPDTVAEMFIRITDDLAYAQTYYPKTQTEKYLNSLALKTHQIIYKTKKEPQNQMVVFWKYIFPLELFQSRKFIIYSFIIFFTATLIGAFSAANDEDFVRLILGDYYVNMTLENIEKGDPMAVYKSANNVDMFLGITIRNIKVSFYEFLFGLFTAFGTGFILFQNGVMLGSFQYFFFEHHVLYQSILSIWIHGTLEIFAIIVSGAAGIILGNSFLFPGTYSRKVSFGIGVRRGTKIVLGLMPVFIIAGSLEGFVTRYTNWPDIFRIAIILGSLTLIVWYFFIYPARLYKKMQNNEDFSKTVNKIIK